MTEAEKLHNIYYSTDDVPFLALLSATQVPAMYPFTDVAPDPAIKKPKFDYRTHQWIDISGETAAKDYNKLSNQIKELESQGMANNETIKQLQEALTAMAMDSSKIDNSKAGETA